MIVKERTEASPTIIRIFDSLYHQLYYISKKTGFKMTININTTIQ